MQICPRTLPGDVHIMTILIRGGTVPPRPCVSFSCSIFRTRTHTAKHESQHAVVNPSSTGQIRFCVFVFMNKHYLRAFQIRCVGAAMAQSALSQGTGQMRSRGSILDFCRKRSDQLWGPTSGCRVVFSRRYSGRNVKLTTTSVQYQG